MPTKRGDDEATIRITQQFRSGGAMVYDFRGASGRLTMRVMGRGGDDVRPPDEWRVEVSMGKSPESTVATEWRPTRAEALSDVGVSWDARRAAHDLPVIDWETVTRAMLAVRAI